ELDRTARRDEVDVAAAFAANLADHHLDIAGPAMLAFDQRLARLALRAGEEASDRVIAARGIALADIAPVGFGRPAHRLAPGGLELGIEDADRQRLLEHGIERLEGRERVGIFGRIDRCDQLAAGDRAAAADLVGRFGRDRLLPRQLAHIIDELDRIDGRPRPAVGEHDIGRNRQPLAVAVDEILAEPGRRLGDILGIEIIVEEGLIFGFLIDTGEHADAAAADWRRGGNEAVRLARADARPFGAAHPDLVTRLHPQAAGAIEDG